MSWSVVPLSELRELTWADVDLDRGLLTLVENKTDDPRTWRMDESTVTALSRWKRLQSPKVRAKGYIIAHPKNGRRFPVGKGAKALRRALEKAKVERPGLLESTAGRTRLRAHDLRATFVTVALSQGKSDSWVVDRTGHRSSAMLYRYKRAARTHAEAELGALSPLHEVIPEPVEMDDE